MTRFRPADTTERADEVQFELLRKMTPMQRAEIFTALTLAVQELALAGWRQRFPNATEDELRMRMAVQRLGAETVRKVWGWSPPESS